MCAKFCANRTKTVGWLAILNKGGNIWDTSGPCGPTALDANGHKYYCTAAQFSQRPTSTHWWHTNEWPNLRNLLILDIELAYRRTVPLRKDPALSRELKVILSHSPKIYIMELMLHNYDSHMWYVLFWPHKWNKNIFINTGTIYQATV